MVAVCGEHNLERHPDRTARAVEERSGREFPQPHPGSHEPAGTDLPNRCRADDQARSTVDGGGHRQRAGNALDQKGNGGHPRPGIERQSSFYAVTSRKEIVFYRVRSGTMNLVVMKMESCFFPPRDRKSTRLNSSH